MSLDRNKITWNVASLPHPRGCSLRPGSGILGYYFCGHKIADAPFRFSPAENPLSSCAANARDDAYLSRARDSFLRNHSLGTVLCDEHRAKTDKRSCGIRPPFCVRTQGKPSISGAAELPRKGTQRQRPESPKRSLGGRVKFPHSTGTRNLSPIARPPFDCEGCQAGHETLLASDLLLEQQTALSVSTRPCCLCTRRRLAPSLSALATVSVWRLGLFLFQLNQYDRRVMNDDKLADREIAIPNH